MKLLTRLTLVVCLSAGLAPLAGCGQNPFARSDDLTAREVWDADQKWLNAQGNTLLAAEPRLDRLLFDFAVEKLAAAQAKLDARKAAIDAGQPDAFLSPRQTAEKEWAEAKGAFVVASKKATASAPATRPATPGVQPPGPAVTGDPIPPPPPG